MGGLSTFSSLGFLLESQELPQADLRICSETIPLSDFSLFLRISFIEPSVQSFNPFSIPSSSRLKWVDEYSTLIGRELITFLSMRPSLSRLLRFSVSTFCEIPSIVFFNSLNRLGVFSRLRSIIIVHLPLIRAKISLEGQACTKIFGVSFSML